MHQWSDGGFAFGYCTFSCLVLAFFASIFLDNPSGLDYCVYMIKHTQTAIIDSSKPVLYDYDTAEAIRNATDGELAASIAAGPQGIITVDGRDCYVLE
jgi:hypothetical protein